ncbi:hypothetical protein ACOTW7_29830 [Burkholderia glumae]
MLKRLEADRFVCWPNGGDTITIGAEQF